MTMTKKRHGKKGFTLVELIVVIAILAILAAILIPLVSQYLTDARDATANANARAAYSAACAFVAKQISTDTTYDAAAVQAGISQYIKDLDGSVTVTLTNDAAKNVESVTWTSTDGKMSATYPD